MIVIRAPRQDIESIITHFFPTINLQKATRLKNVKHLDRLSDEYLGAVIINCELTKIELMFKKQLINSASKRISLKFTNAEAVVLYKSFIILPIDSEHVYYIILRDSWIKQLEQSLITIGLYQHDDIIHL